MPSERWIPAKVFMLGLTGTNEPQMGRYLWRLSNTQDLGKVVSMWDIHTSQTPRGCDVTKAGTAARPKGGHPEGERNTTRNPQI